jgi:hypothetical protein
MNECSGGQESPLMNKKRVKMEAMFGLETRRKVPNNLDLK